ncbi:MAG: exodeoxyribonuclease VII small subunit [Gammaproteobacteria bacterium]|nr:exodeoxyribonuclease VII small subunit [Gammaproteobacteria bacterium]
MDFEATLKKLNTLVDELERGGLSLEEALKSFEKGVKLTQTCQAALETAEQKVQILVEEHGLHKLEPYDDSDAQ